MCEINPKHSAFFRLEVFTSNPKITSDQFLAEVLIKTLHMYIVLIEDIIHVDPTTQEQK
jgi:hypothetical protein